MARRPVLTKTEIKHIAEDLDTSHGYLPHLVKEKPWLIDMSRQYLCNHGFCGDKFPVFRSVALMRMAVSPGEYVAPHIQTQVDAASTLRPESVVSSSLNPSAVLVIAAHQADQMYFTGGFLRGGLISTKPVILRYDITVDRVILYIPALIAFIRALYPPEELKKTRYRSRSGGLYSVPYIFRELEHRQEEEIIADVTDLKPEVYETDGDRSEIWLARDMLDPNFDSVEWMKKNHEWGYLPHPPIMRGEDYVAPPPTPPGPTPEQVEKVKWMDEFLKFVREFFGTPWMPQPPASSIV